MRARQLGATMRSVTIPLLLLASISCRKDAAEESQIEWSCVRMQKNAAPIATSDCLVQMTKEKSPVLRYYKPVPVKNAQGKVLHFAMVERATPLLPKKVY